MPGPRVEILAHVAAPSRAVDDTRYRTLAQGYLDFQPDRRPVFFGPPSEDGQPSQSIIGFGTQRNSKQPRHGVSFNLESPQLSFRSVENNLNSPRPRQQTPLRPQHSSQLDASSWQAPPSEIPDTFPDSNLPLPELCSPTRLLEHYLSTEHSSQLDQSPLARLSVEKQQVSFDSTQETTRPFSSPEQQGSQKGENHQGDGPLESAPASQQAALNTTVLESPTPTIGSKTRPAPTAVHAQEVLSSNEPRVPQQASGGSVIPQSPPLLNKRPLPAQPTTRSSGDVSHISSSHISENEVETPPRAESEPTQSKRARRSAQDPSPGKILPRSISDVGPHQKPSTRATQQRLNPNGKTLANSFKGLEIRSPEPPVGDEALHPDDLIAEAIGSLARELDLQKRFKPASQSREIRPFERGHWLIDCTIWDEELKWSSWAFLAGYLPNGHAGWGVWCERDPEFSRIRLWCFGYMVGHLHLLVYLFSKRKVLYTGSRWIAADGEPVIIMGAKQPPG